jgi:ABC-type sugar transport system substrate-binding protein
MRQKEREVRFQIRSDWRLTRQEEKIMKLRKATVLALTASMAAALAAGCGSSGSSGSAASGSSASGSKTDSSSGKVYYLNFKPEADEYWQELAKRVHRARPASRLRF